jgi:hypothetical protein
MANLSIEHAVASLGGSCPDMFVGHYGISFAARDLAPSLPVWLLFIAVQLVDIVWAVLIMLGIEKVRIVPGFTGTNPLDLYYMPYTHSLLAALLWALAAAILYRFIKRPNGLQAAAVLGIAVLSHWVLDYLVHVPDLPLYDNQYKVGLGLWNFPIIAFLLEVIFLFGGMVLYLRATRGSGFAGRYGFIMFGFVMLAIQLSVFFGPPPPSDNAIAAMALFSYIVFAAVIAWLEKKRHALSK